MKNNREMPALSFILYGKGSPEVSHYVASDTDHLIKLYFIVDLVIR
jgi:hypothetical protein